MSDFHGEVTRILENAFIQLEYLAEAPRIVRLSLKGNPNLFADLGKSPISTPYGDFYFRGGHRLWHAPEAMPRTYIPDNEGATTTEIKDGVRIEQPPEVWTHIAKSMEIRLDPGEPCVTLRHELRNDGAWTVEFAPWAITQFRQGGVVILPQPTGNADPEGLLSNRQLMIWPYTKVQDARLQLADDFILLNAQAALPPCKIGYFNPHGWMGYWLDGILFIKRYGAQPDASFPDHGCNAETYCNDEFVELESLGPLVQLPPGETVVHEETWELYEGLAPTFIPDDLRGRLTR